MSTLKVFEHQSIQTGEELLFYRGNVTENRILDERYISALWKMYDEKKRPFFKPIRNGIKFCEWVGVIKVLDITVEILPKADKIHSSYDQEKQKKEHTKWQSILIDMLRACRSLNTPSISDASLKLKCNSILDLYIERFIKEVNYLLNSGLIKKYRGKEINARSLKGKLLIQKHTIKNIIHKERFYLEQPCYDKDHVFHRILYKAIKILPYLCNNQALVSLCYQLQINFPEVSDVKIDEYTFQRIVFDRKSEPYKPAIQIAKLLLLNYRPDVSSGSANSIAILFDMNKLWEEYIYRMLQKANTHGLKIHTQKSAKFWFSQSTNRYLRPDIVIERITLAGTKEYMVIDTKWKNIYGDVKNIGMDDIRQMFAYHHYFDAIRCYLLYPGSEDMREGNFIEKSFFNKHLGNKSCGIIVSNAWQTENGTFLDKDIGVKILNYLGLAQ